MHTIHLVTIKKNWGNSRQICYIEVVWSGIDFGFRSRAGSQRSNMGEQTKEAKNLCILIQFIAVSEGFNQQLLKSYSMKHKTYRNTKRELCKQKYKNRDTQTQNHTVLLVHIITKYRINKGKAFVVCIFVVLIALLSKVKVCTLIIVPLCESSPQKR